MKKMLFTALVAVFGLTSSAYAQFSAGTIAVGGGISISSENTKYESGSTTVEGDPTTSFNLSPSVGYFLADDLEVGVQVDFTRSGQSGEDFNGDDYSEVSTIFAFGPYARKYFSLGESAAFYGEAGLGIGAGKSKYEQGSTTYEYNKMSIFSVGVTPGFVFRPAERIGVELSAGFFGFTSVKSEDPEGDDEDLTTKSNDFGLSLDLSNVSLGVKFYL